VKSVPQLAGLTEVAELLHVSKRTASRYTERPDFPEPLQRLASGPIWSADEVSHWAAQHLPLVMGWKRGRPRKQ
jgi:predicted DNA-binding transcriptional regulator AlpA